MIFPNAIVQLENIFPYTSAILATPMNSGGTLLGVGAAFYFCIPPNDKLLEYWDTVADRLYKIRHSMNIEGVERRLALFAPPIDPAVLVNVVAKGLNLGSILADLSSPPPIYRFNYLLQKANEFCSEVKALGSTLLSVIEKKDAEELGRLRASHESSMLGLMTNIKEMQILEARANKENLEKIRETANQRLQHYTGLLNISITVDTEPQISGDLTKDSMLPADSAINGDIKTEVDETVVDSDESGVKLILKEKEEIDKMNISHIWQLVSSSTDLASSEYRTHNSNSRC